MYRLILSDLDETLLVNHHVPDFNIAAIRKARQKGVKFVPATGRSYNMITDILRGIGTYGQAGEYSICFNGGLIVENEKNRILNFKRLSFKHVKSLFEKAQDHDVCVLIYTLDMCYIYNANDDEIKRKKAQKAPFTIVDHNSIEYLKDKEIAKVLYQNINIDYLKKIAQELKSMELAISFSSNRYLEFNALGVDKGYGLRWLANYLNIKIDETIAVGDNYNDIEMIKAANIGICVKSAHDDIKEVAQYVTKLDYDQGAIKEVIEKFILEEKRWDIG